MAVELTAVCGSDLHPYLGREPGYDPGMVPGHEFVGRVVALGNEVRHLQVGLQVHAPFSTSCGGCPTCRRGLTARCERGQLFGWVQGGLGLHGAQAELVRVPLADTTLVPVPEGIGAEEALLLGDVLATGFHGARGAAVRPGSRVAVVGCGPVGLMAVVGCLELGAELVVAIDPVPERRALAAAFGAEACGSLSPQEVLAELTPADRRGFDAVVEAVGSAASTRLAFDLLAPGGVLSSVGVHTRPEFGFSPVEAYDKNLTLRSGRCSARTWMRELVPLVLSRRYALAEVISHRFDLAQGAQAYEMVAGHRDGCAKVVLAP